MPTVAVVCGFLQILGYKASVAGITYAKNMQIGNWKCEHRQWQQEQQLTIYIYSYIYVHICSYVRALAIRMPP